MKALFVVNTMTYFNVLIDPARFLKKKSEYQPILYFAFPYPTIDRDIAFCKKEKIRYITGNSLLGDSGKQLSLPKKFLLYSINSNFLTSIVDKIIKYKREFSKVKKVIDNLNPEVIILAGDNVGYNTSIFIKLGHKKNIPSIIVPLWMAGANEAAEAYRYDRRYSYKKLLNRLCASLYPKWVHNHNGNKMLRWPADTLLTIKLFGLEPPSPWSLNSGFADAIAAESKAMYNYMIREKLPANQLRVTGSLSNDILAENVKTAAKRKRKTFEKIGFDPNKPTILCALPPDQFTGFGRRCEFNNFQELVKFWIKRIADTPDYNVMVSLHPSIKFEDVYYIEEKWKVKIMREPIAELIPLCDLFIACISSTIQWAIVCGKPVINYDAYRYHYTDYEGVLGVVTVDTKSAFLNELHQTTKNHKYFEELKKAAGEAAKDWGMLDGNSGKRILKVIDSLVSERTARNGSKK